MRGGNGQQRAWAGKRLLDLVLVLSSVWLWVPLLILVGLGVWWRLGRPILFRQERAGLGGKRFRLVKFRTMRDLRDERGGLLADAERMTPFGSWLRSSSLDELPELWNVLRGEMSLVGPRPLPVRYVGRYSGEQARRLEVLPGLTGWAQVSGRNALDWEARFEKDLWYVENRSFGLDVKILWLTIRAVLKREGISGGDGPTMEEFRGSEGSVAEEEGDGRRRGGGGRVDPGRA